MLLSLWLKSSVLTPGTSKESGVAGIPKALSYWLRLLKHSLHLGHRILYALPILYIAELE